jgi:uncharacterized protein YbjQ (UPF0145 family)
MAKNCSVCGEKMGGLFGAIESLDVQGVCCACIFESKQDEGDSSDSLTTHTRLQDTIERNEKISRLFVTTVQMLDGYLVKEYLGVARGGTVRAKHAGSDFLAGVKNIVGGEIKGYTALLADAREEAMYRMKLDAYNMGADAVIGVNFSTSMIDVGAAEITAFGTAVKLEVSNNSKLQEEDL